MRAKQKDLPGRKKGLYVSTLTACERRPSKAVKVAGRLVQQSHLTLLELRLELSPIDQGFRGLRLNPTLGFFYRAQGHTSQRKRLISNPRCRVVLCGCCVALEEMLAYLSCSWSSSLSLSFR